MRSFQRGARKSELGGRRVDSQSPLHVGSLNAKDEAVSSADEGRYIWFQTGQLQLCILYEENKDLNHHLFAGQK